MSDAIDFLDMAKADLLSMPYSQDLTWHVHSRNILMPLLERLQPASLSSEPHDQVADALQLSHFDASRLVEGHDHIPVPIFTRSPHNSLSASYVDVETLLSDAHYKNTEILNVQVASDPASSGPQSKTIADIRHRFRDKRLRADPWNILGARKRGECPLPGFLDGENCSLLPEILLHHMELARRASLDDKVETEKSVETWMQAVSWFLLAEAGALTTTHQDALGLGTWITCYQGAIGFAWLSRPSTSDLDRWQQDPDHFNGGEWRYQILRPGETVYFDPGLVHCVFRRRADNEQTLALGGHVFRRSIVGIWARMLDRHIDLITPKDLVAPETRQTPLPFNEDVRHVLRYGKELLEAVEALFVLPRHIPSLNARQVSEFQMYRNRLMERFKSLQRVEMEVDRMEEMRESFVKADQTARARALASRLRLGTTDHDHTNADEDPNSRPPKRYRHSISHRHHTSATPLNSVHHSTVTIQDKKRQVLGSNSRLSPALRHRGRQHQRRKNPNRGTRFEGFLVEDERHPHEAVVD